MKIHPLRAERTGRHDEANNRFSQFCQELPPKIMYSLLDVVKDDLGLKTPRCVVHPLWRLCSGLRWTNRTSVKTIVRRLSHMARTIPQVSGSVCKHRPSHPNLWRQNPFLPNPSTWTVLFISDRQVSLLGLLDPKYRVIFFWNVGNPLPNHTVLCYTGHESSGNS
jgi:hypothetical protein